MQSPREEATVAEQSDNRWKMLQRGALGQIMDLVDQGQRFPEAVKQNHGHTAGAEGAEENHPLDLGIGGISIGLDGSTRYGIR